MINITLLKTAYPELLWGAAYSLYIACVSTLIGLIGGTLLAIGQTSSLKILKKCIDLYVNLVRGTPMIVQIVFLYYGLNIPIDPLHTAIIAIGLNSSAYISQIIRSGIASVAKGQIEAGLVLGLTKFQITRYIILPQAIYTMLPAIGNELITLIKDSSLAYIIGVQELFKTSRNLMNTTYDVLTIYFAVTILYLLMTTTASAIINKIERSWKQPCS